MTREGDRQTSARLGFAKNDFGDGLATLHTRIRRPHERADTVGRGFVHDHAIRADHACRHHLRLGAHQHHDQRLAGLAGHVGKRLEHGVLPAEQFQCGGGAGLADQLHHIAHNGDNKIGMTRVVHRLIQQLLVELGGDGELRTRLAVRIELAFRIVHQVDDVRAARIHDLASFGRKLLEPVKDGGDHAARLAFRHPIDLAGIAGPIAQLFLGVVGQRAHDGDALARSGRERQCAIVLEQRHGFARDLQVELLMGLGADNRFDALLVRQTRILEQTQAELQRENARHGLIDQRFI